MAFSVNLSVVEVGGLLDNLEKPSREGGEQHDVIGWPGIGCRHRLLHLRRSQEKIASRLQVWVYHFIGGILGIFLQDWLFYAGRHSDKQPLLGPYVQWTHLMHGPEKD